MNETAALHFFTGKMAAGKSTLAKKIAAEHEAILLSEDELLSKLYPDEIKELRDYAKYSSRLKSSLTKHIQDILSSGISVVLDFPANTLRQRKWFKEIISENAFAHNLHFIDASDETCKKQLKERSKDKPAGTPFTSEAEFEGVTKYFEAPTEEEGFHITMHKR